MDSRELLTDFEKAVRQLQAALGISAEHDVIKAGASSISSFHSSSRGKQ